MRFSVYVRRLETHVKILKFHRSNQGLYMLSRHQGMYTSYHEDGNYWIRSAGKKTVKSLREPLRGFTGAETLTLVYVALDVDAPIANADAGPLRAVPDDIVLEQPGRFVGVEVILTERPIMGLPQLPNRLNSRVYCRDFRPFLVLEAFTLNGNEFPGPRFHRPPRALYHGAGMPPRI